jgi:hypothetical protein
MAEDWKEMYFGVENIGNPLSLSTKDKRHWISERRYDRINKIFFPR